MDEDEQQDACEGDTSDEGEHEHDEKRGKYSTIESRCLTVQRYHVSGLSLPEYVEANPQIQICTLDKWVTACDQEQWQDFLARLVET